MKAVSTVSTGNAANTGRQRDHTPVTARSPQSITVDECVRSCPARKPEINDNHEFTRNAANGNLAAVRAAIEGGMKVDARTLNSSEPAIVTAARAGQVQIVDYLITQGALENREIARQLASATGNPSIYYLACVAKLKPLARNVLAWLAFSDRELELADDWTTSVRNMATATDRTLLMEAATGGRLKTVMKLIKSRSFSTPDQLGALQTACKHMQYENAGFLAAGLSEQDRYGLLKAFFTRGDMPATHTLINTFDDVHATRQRLRADFGDIRPNYEPWLWPTASPARLTSL